jgi:MFS family permease
MGKVNVGGTSVFRVRSEAARPFGVVWLSHLLVEIYLLMHPALLPVFRSEFGLSIFEAGLLVSAPSICRLVIVIPTGVFADRFGSKPFIVLSMLISGLSAVLLSQSSTAFVLLVSLSLIMISVTLYHPPGLSIVSRLFPEQAERSTAIGLHGASGCIGQSVGTISLGLLMPHIGWRNCYLLFSMPIIAWALAVARAKVPRLSRHAPKQESQAQNVRKLSHQAGSAFSFGFFLLLSAMGLNALANSGVSAFMTTYLTSSEDLSVELASMIFGAGPLIGIVGSLGAGFLSARLGDRNALALFFLGQVVFLIGLIGIPYLPLATVSFLMYELFLAAIWTPASSMVTSLMGRTGGGTAYSLFYFAGDALGAISPLIAATLITGLNILAPFVFAIALLATNALLVMLIKATRKT